MSIVEGPRQQVLLSIRVFDHTVYRRLDVETAVPLEHLGGRRANLVLLLQALEVRVAIGLLLLQAGPLLVDGVDAPTLAGLRLGLGVDHCTPPEAMHASTRRDA